MASDINQQVPVNVTDINTSLNSEDENNNIMLTTLSQTLLEQGGGDWQLECGVHPSPVLL